MGVNISIVDMRTNKDVEGWDWARYAGDREVFSVLHAVPHADTIWGHLEDGISFMRPHDVEQFRAELHTALGCNAERWNQMCDLLAEDENRGLYFSW